MIWQYTKTQQIQIHKNASKSLYITLKGKNKISKKKRAKNIQQSKILANQYERKWLKYTINIAEESAKGGGGTQLIQLDRLTESQVKFSGIDKLKVKK